LYERIKFLEIKRAKNTQGYNTQQVASLDQLHEHILKTGKMDGFTKSAEPTKAIVLVDDSNIERQQQPNLPVEPITPTFSSADIQQIKLEAQQRVKTKRLAVLKIAQAYEEDPSLLPLEIRTEMEQEEMALLSTPLSHRGYYDPNALAQAVLASL
jgi:hypothetical protein